MLNIRDELKSDLKELFKRVNNDFYLKDYNDDPENMEYFIKDNCTLYRPWSGDLWQDKNDGLFAVVIFDKFAVKYKNGYKLVFSENKYRAFLNDEFIQDVFPIVAIHASAPAPAPAIIAFYYSIDDYALTWYDGKLQAYKIHTTPAGRLYIATKYRRFYMDQYINIV